MAMPVPDVAPPALADPEQFKAAMQRFPSGVVIATTRGADGGPRGFTASSFTSVSVAPPMVLLCLANAAACHRDFCEATHFAVNILGHRQEALAWLFATRGADKFAGGRFLDGPRGLPFLEEAIARMTCRLHATHVHGDHTLLVAEVEAVELGDDADAMLRFRQRFVRMAQESPA